MKKFNSRQVRSPKNFSNSRKIQEPVIEKKLPRSLEEKKKFFADWVQENKIPGKIQAWFTQTPNEELADWRIVNELQGKHFLLKIIAPSKGFAVPNVVQSIHAQLRKEHLKAFKNAIRQIWFRALGNNRFALLLQANLHGNNSNRGYRSFLEYLQRMHSDEITACFHLECRPAILFDPSHPPRSLSIELKEGFGNEFQYIDSLPYPIHILDRLPRQKSLWIQFPEKLKSTIHPSAEDRLLMFNAGSGLLAESLANSFSHVECAEIHAYGEKAARQRQKNSAFALRVHRSAAEAEWVEKFFKKTEPGKNWTVYLYPEDKENLTASTIAALAKAAPARILLHASSLENALKNIKQFRREGYMLRKILPLDFTPQESEFEVLFFFVPDRNGLLGNKALQEAKKRAIKPKERKFTLQKSKFEDFEQDIPHFIQRKRTLSGRND